MGTTVSSILKHKGHDVVTVAPQQTVTWVVECSPKTGSELFRLSTREVNSLGSSPSATSSAACRSMPKRC